VSTPNPKRERELRDRRLAGKARLGAIEAPTADKVAALVAALGDTEATAAVIKALEEYGADATAALPALRRLKTSPLDTVKNAAITAIAKIESATPTP
jgi:uncharacterized caspase-like protein